MCPGERECPIVIVRDGLDRGPPGVLRRPVRRIDDHGRALIGHQNLAGRQSHHVEKECVKPRQTNWCDVGEDVRAGIELVKEGRRRKQRLARGQSHQDFAVREHGPRIVRGAQLNLLPVDRHDRQIGSLCPGIRRRQIVGRVTIGSKQKDSPIGGKDEAWSQFKTKRRIGQDTRLLPRQRVEVARVHPGIQCRNESLGFEFVVLDAAENVV